jgi:hypothetical protein
LLPIGEKITVGLNGVNWSAYAGLMPLNRLSSFRNPVPAVVKTAPDLTFVLKKSAGKSLRSLNGTAPAPSQPISRRPVGCSPAVPPFDAPRMPRNSSTFAAMLPVALYTVTGSTGPTTGSVILSPPHAATPATATNDVHVNLRISFSDV